MVTTTQKNAENEATVEKKQLSKDLYYYCTKRTINFIYFNYKSYAKKYLKEKYIWF